MTLKRTGPPKRNRPLERRTEPRRDTPGARKFVEKHRGRPISPASTQQRAARSAVGYCIVCGATEEYDGIPIDPAHIVPRKRGGCDSRFCTLPLCRPCHDRMDGRAQPPIDILKVLVGDWNTWRHHYQHALRHELPAYVFERLAGARTQWSDAG